MSIWMFFFCFFALEQAFARGIGRGLIATVGAEERELHFVLIHGASHGAWAWYRLEDALQKAGFNVSSVDLAGAGIHPADPDSVATWEEYDKPAIDLFESLPERAPHQKTNNTRYRYLDGTNNPPTSFYFPLSTVGRVLYNGLDSEITVLASKLLRPQPARMLGTPINYTRANHGRIPAVYIGYADDKALPPVAQRYVVKHYGPFRKVINLSGGHFNFLQRPKEFTKLLTKLADQYT